MKKQTTDDDFWTDDVVLFEGTFRRNGNRPQPVRGKLHVSDEKYFHVNPEIVPISNPGKGQRTYVMLNPYVFEPKVTFIVGLYNTPKQFADQGEAIGETLASRPDGVREVQIGNAQAWYYPSDKMIVLWECYLWDFVRDHALGDDTNMKSLCKGFEKFLTQQFPDATRMATPFNDPIAKTMEEYQ